MDVPNKRRQEPYRRRMARNAIPNQAEDEPQTMGEKEAAQAKILSGPRKDDAAYRSYLRRGSKATGVKTASETGARGMANQGEIDRLKGAIKVNTDFEARKRLKAKREIT